MPGHDPKHMMLQGDGSAIGCYMTLAIVLAALIKRGLITREEIGDGMDGCDAMLTPGSDLAANVGLSFSVVRTIVSAIYDAPPGEQPSWKSAERPAWFRGVVE